MSDITISYKGNSIATMDASGTKTLLTEGKYCEDDIEVAYTKPASPSGTKSISITQNGTTTEDVTQYASAEIAVNVPNSYAAGDEGKVVSNGALVSQSSDSVTQNGTVDTTLISSLTVNVSGGISLDDFVQNQFLSGAYTLSVPLWEYALDHKGRAGTPWTVKYTHTTGISGRALAYTRGLTAVVITKSNYYSNAYIYQSKELQVIDTAENRFPSGAWADNTSMTTLVLRHTSVPQLNNANAVSGTPFKSGGTGGTIYIPKSLYDHLGDGTSSDYKAATNWSTINGYGTITWAKIEGSQYEHYYADGTPIPTT